MLWVIGSFVAIIGVIIPLGIQWMQQRNFQKISDNLLEDATKRYESKIDELKSENEINNREKDISFDKKINNLSEANNRELEIINNVFADNLKEIDEKYNLYIAKVEANFFGLNAINYFDDEKFYRAGQLYLTTLYFYRKIESPNLKNCLGRLIQCIENTAIEERLEIINYSFRDFQVKDLISFLKDNGLHSELTTKLESLIVVG